MYIIKAETTTYRFRKTHLFVLQDPGFGVRKTRVSGSVRPRSCGSHTLWPELQDMGVTGAKTRVLEDSNPMDETPKPYGF